MWDIQGPSIRLHAVVIDFYAETTATVGEVTMSRAPRVDEAADLCWSAGEKCASSAKKMLVGEGSPATLSY
jgi:hypothetical protein